MKKDSLCFKILKKFRETCFIIPELREEITEKNLYNGLLARKSKKVNYLVKNLAFYLAISSIISCVMYRSVVFQSPLVGITLLASISLTAITL